MSQNLMPTQAGPVLGVLGGLGPAATLDFLQRVLANTHAVNDQDHIATLVYSDPSTPDRSTAIVSDGPSPLASLLHGISYLSTAGVDAIAVPCNTAHYWYEEMVNVSQVPIINMVEEVEKRIRSLSKEIKTIGLMSTLATARAGVYKTLISHGFELLDLAEHGAQNPIERGIRVVKSGNLLLGREHLVDGAKELINNGAQALIFGCTEISTVFNDKDSDFTVPTFDSSEILAQAAIDSIKKIRSNTTKATDVPR